VVGIDGKVHYANAGHTFPYVVRDAGGATAGLEVLPVRSNPLGSNHPLIADGEYQLDGGDFMVLTSDGLTDRVSETGTRFGDKRLRRALVEEATKGTQDVKTLSDRIVGDVNTFGGAQPCDDDITLVIVQYNGTASGSGDGSRPRRQTLRRGVAA